MLFFNQVKLEKFIIEKKHKRILWINISAPSLGDSLMDLSSRVLLQDKSIDLFTSKKNAHLFYDDKVFNGVYSDISQRIDKEYDLIILDSYSTRSMKIKRKIAKNTYFVGMFGFFNGPEVNRVLFSFFQMNNLLPINEKKDMELIQSEVKNSIAFNQKDIDIIDSLSLPRKFISIVIGGEWDYRKYRKWAEVISLLIAYKPDIKIVLLGSENALKDSKKILAKFPTGNIYDFINRLSFKQSAIIISKSDRMLCCDGGLMHAGNASGVISVSLFAKLTPKMQLTDAIKSFPLFDKEDVNNIHPKEIYDKFLESYN